MMYNDTAFMPHKVTAVEGGDRNCTLELDVGSGGYITPPRPPVFTPVASDFCPRCWDAGQHGGCPVCGKVLPVIDLNGRWHSRAVQHMAELRRALPPISADELKRSGQTLKLAQIQNTVDVAIRVLEEQLGCLNAARAQLQLVRDSL